MSDESILRALGKLAREQRAEVVPEELTTDSRPGRDRAREVALAGLGIEAGGAAKAATDPAPAAQERSAPPASGGGATRDHGRPRSSRRWRRLFGLPAAALAAAALLIVVRAGRPTPTLPVYALAVTGGVSTLRAAGAPAARLLVEEGARVEVGLRPAERVAGPVEVHCYWSKDGKRVRWLVEPERAEGGALRIIAPAPRPFGAGPGQLLVVIGRPGEMPSDEPADAEVLPRPRAQLLSWPVDWR